MKAIMVAGLHGLPGRLRLLALIDAMHTPRVLLMVVPGCAGLRHRDGDAELPGLACRTPPSGATSARRPAACCSCARWAVPSAARWSARCWPSGFAARLAEIGITAHIDLGEVRQHGGALASVAPATMPHVQAALADAFHLAFLACAVAMGIAVVVALGMRDLPLRTSAASAPPETNALAH